jgi:hypothetical protein
MVLPNASGGFVRTEGPVTAPVSAFEAFAAGEGTWMGQLRYGLQIMAFHANDARELMWGGR